MGTSASLVQWRSGCGLTRFPRTCPSSVLFSLAPPLPLSPRSSSAAAPLSPLSSLCSAPSSAPRSLSPSPSRCLPPPVPLSGPGRPRESPSPCPCPCLWPSSAARRPALFTRLGSGLWRFRALLGPRHTGRFRDAFAKRWLARPALVARRALSGSFEKGVGGGGGGLGLGVYTSTGRAWALGLRGATVGATDEVATSGADVHGAHSLACPAFADCPRIE